MPPYLWVRLLLKQRHEQMHAYWLMILLAVLIANRVEADEPTDLERDTIDYGTQVKPVLIERCVACHGALKQEGGLRLDTSKSMIAGGSSGQAIVPGLPKDSPIVERITATDLSIRMPPEGEPLHPHQIEAIQKWIADGAVAPEDERPEADPREHWAFQTPVRPAIPRASSLSGNGAASNPIDLFLEESRQPLGLASSPNADRRIWLRRVSLDLIGLPPTLEEQEAFVSDNASDAYEKVVDRLLNSPRYGERWGRHWMDVWRYSDWWGLGAEVRNSQKHMWHWRDWIIESLNADKGYDQMLLEMLAADELYPNDLDKLRATGYLARQYFRFNRTTWLDETIEHTSKAMLGLTLNCAKCHDHKYDPISQEDYYRFRAIFEPYQVRTELIPGECDIERDGIPRVFDCNLDAKTFLHIRGDERRPDSSQPMEPAVPAILMNGSWQVQTVELPLEAVRPGLRAYVAENYLQDAERKIDKAKTSYAVAKEKLSQQTPQEPQANDSKADLELQWLSRQLAVAEANKASIAARLIAERLQVQPEAGGLAQQANEHAIYCEKLYALSLVEANLAQAQYELALAAAEKIAEATQKRDAALAAVDTARQSLQSKDKKDFTSIAGAIKTPESNVESQESLQRAFPSTSTGRRTALARWLIHPKHPLTARVAINHLWMRHMGQPLVPTVFEFGRKGTPPTQAKLLDWLAVELVEHDWSMKHIHRLITTSQAYRMSSSRAAIGVDGSQEDSANAYYGRGNTMRMDAQVVRDSLLSLAGELDLACGGSSVPINNDQSRRRSIYFFHSHNEHHKFLSMFDDASVLDCYRRAESIVPQQALALENSPFATEMSQRIADRIHQQVGECPEAERDSNFVRLAFLTILATEPKQSEQALVMDAFHRWKQLAQEQNRPQPEAVARTNTVQALLNHNDFVTIR